MYIDLSCYDRNLTDEDIHRAVFYAVEYQLNCVSVPSYYLSIAKDYGSNIKISMPVDYPEGTQDSKTRTHSVLNACKKSVDFVDVVTNSYLVSNKHWKQLEKEFKEFVDICKDYGSTLRVFLEYRLFPEDTITIAKMAGLAGIDYVFPSTGNMVDNYSDNILCGIAIKKRCPNLNVISNGRVFTQEQLEVVEASKLYGVRLHNSAVVKRIFGV